MHIVIPVNLLPFNSKSDRNNNRIVSNIEISLANAVVSICLHLMVLTSRMKPVVFCWTFQTQPYAPSPSFSLTSYSSNKDSSFVQTKLKVLFFLELRFTYLKYASCCCWSSEMNRWFWDLLMMWLVSIYRDVVFERDAKVNKYVQYVEMVITDIAIKQGVCYYYKCKYYFL